MTAKRLIQCFTVLLLMGSMGCTSSKAQLLKLYPYRRNLILDKDHAIYFVKFQKKQTVKEELPLATLGPQMNKRGVRKTDPIVLHHHRFAAESVVDQVVGSLRQAGYISVYCIQFRDPEAVVKKENDPATE